MCGIYYRQIWEHWKQAPLIYCDCHTQLRNGTESHPAQQSKEAQSSGLSQGYSLPGILEAISTLCPHSYVVRKTDLKFLDESKTTVPFYSLFPKFKKKAIFFLISLSLKARRKGKYSSSTMTLSKYSYS